MASYSWVSLDTVDADYRHAIFCDPTGLNDGSATDDGELQSATISSITSITALPATGLADDDGSLAEVTIRGDTYAVNTAVTVKLTATVVGNYEVIIKVATSDSRALTRRFAIKVEPL